MQETLHMNKTSCVHVNLHNLRADQTKKSTTTYSNKSMMVMIKSLVTG